MRRIIFTLTLACICSLSISAAFAGDSGAPGCSGKAMVKGASCTKTCSVSVEGFPKITMMVGDKSYDCCMSAAKAAKDANSKVVYAVGDEKFDCKDKATVALADLAERHVARFTTIACVADGKVMFCSDSGCCSGHGAMAKADGKSCHGEMTMAKSEGKSCAHAEAKTTEVSAKGEGKTCPHAEGKTTAVAAKSEGAGCCKSGAKAGAMVKSEGGCCHGSGKAMAMSQKDIDACCKNAKEVKFMVCGRTFTKRDDAEKARRDVLDSMKTIKMSYIVDGKEVDCASKVCPVAKKEGKVVYVVNKEKMNCEFEARIALAKAQFEAARDYAEKLAKI